MYKKNVNLVAATCSICGSTDFMRTYCDIFGGNQNDDMFFDVVIMDEASKATPLEMAVPLDYSTISEQVQGIAFYNDKLLISHSFGILPSRLVFYEQSDKRLYVNENSARTYRFPERLEQIVVEGDSLYVMFESCAYAYRASSVNIVDRVLKLNLSKMETYDEEESLFFLSE